MTLLDSNVLIRIITGDSQEVAHSLLEQIESSKKNSFYITSAVLVEVCFVLEFHDYAMVRADIYSAVKRLVGAPQIAISQDSVDSLGLYKRYPKLHFTDCYLLAKAKSSHMNILTLDKSLQKLASLKQL